MGWQGWLASIGGIIAIVGQWWGANYYLPAIGGLLALIGGIGAIASGGHSETAVPTTPAKASTATPA